MRRRVKALWAGLLQASGLLFLVKKWIQHNGPIVLTFHRVLSDEELQRTASLPGMIVRQRTFDHFLQYASENCELIDLNRGPEWQHSAKLKLAITFDDGWSDNAISAFPIARKHRAPIAIFIVAKRMGMELPFWPERAAAILEQKLGPTTGLSQSSIETAIEELKELAPEQRERRIAEMANGLNSSPACGAVDSTMTWEQVAELQARGVVFGSHTNTHEILTTIPSAQAREEIIDSRKAIEEKLLRDCSLFSYPNGNHSPEIRAFTANAGYKYAFTNQTPGVWTRDCDPYLIPRVNVCETHMVDAKGNFSTLIFNYAVVWSAAKGLMSQRRASYLRKFTQVWRSWNAKPRLPAEKSR